MSAAPSLPAGPTRSLTILTPPPDEKRRPVAPTLPGVASAIDEVLKKQDDTHRTLREHTGALDRVEEVVTVHGYKIAAVERKVDVLVSQGEDHHERILGLEHPNTQRGHRTAPGAQLVVAAKIPSIPPEELDKLGRASKSGTWHFDQDMVMAAITGLREQIDGLEQAAEVEQALKLQAEKDRADEERRSARLRGWLALTIAALVMLGGLFAWLAPRMGK